MGFKTILVMSTRAERAGAAETFGRAGGALRRACHGPYVRRPFQAPAFTDAGPAMDSLYRTYENAAKADEALATAAFRDVIGSTRLSSEWRVTDGLAEEVVAAYARYADLVIIGQAEPDAMATTTPRDLAETVAMAGERPVLIVPHIGVTKPPGKTVMLCWNGSREAARAATGALPFLKAGRQDDHPACRSQERWRRTAGCRHRPMACPARREGGCSTRYRRQFRRRRRDPVACRRPGCRSDRHGPLRPFARARVGAGRRQPHAVGQHDGAAARGALRR